MTLRELTSYLPKSVASGDLGKSAIDVTSDSREVKEGFIFVAIRGNESDGHKYISQAVEAGAVAIVAEIAPDERWGDDCAWIHVKNSRLALASLANAIQGQPSASLKVIGVTGTNGKTTTTYLAHHIMQTVLRRAGLMGTVKFHDGIEEVDATHTTPGPVELQKALKSMVDNECRGVAMEVSSHGIEQNRVEGVQFDAAVFTNLTQDHLDYHGSMEAYFGAKKRLFAQLKMQEGKKKPVAVINLDDRHGESLVKELGDQIKVTTYGMGAHCDFKASKIRQTMQGTEFQLDNRGKSFLVRTPLIGRFNVYNALAAIASCAAVGVKVRDAVQAMAEAPQVPGRMELVGFKEGFSVFVDYAHTPDALQNVCTTLKELEPNRLITVFGCGGDRDQKKRPLMGEVASENSNICLITSDNPRSENPEDIIAMIEKGMKNKQYRVIADREEAIRAAVNIADKGDVVLIAGKGHETYQQFADDKIDFDDRQVARWALRDRPAPKNDKR
ncbi:UDP-N-acetylmuramoyl-L-alanyl-D-glutamate--2, 6-diaminopimelate ligase [Rubritalea halochordaticola]|uniref:UDP-N-acetylmuramoyl-L-alanyl-D-glutamate--2,6-diaminopimelate ligase n=1 Tax=Rubritalea halochordaticola TaxID=714537 RepID=A0ABP9UW24_9BACT